MTTVFTLIELLVVIAIIAMLLAILLPALSSAGVSTMKMENYKNAHKYQYLQDIKTK